MDTSEKFEAKVKRALQEVMRHAVAGHSGRGDILAVNNQHNGMFNTFCNDPEHALAILAKYDLVTTNARILETILDK